MIFDIETSLYFIYNTINNKIYIGITNNIKRRWKDHIKVAKSQKMKKYLIHKAIAKYGISNFIFKEIMKCPNFRWAKIIEDEFIIFFKSNGYEVYNMDQAHITFHSPMNKNSIQYKNYKSNLSARMKGKNNHMYGVRLYGKANGNYGKKMKPHVKESLLKIRRKLTQENVDEIRKLYYEKLYNQPELAKKFNISLTQINRIILLKKWSNNVNKNRFNKERLKQEEIINIKNMFKNGIKICDISKQLNIDSRKIGKIVNNKTYKNIK